MDPTVSLSHAYSKPQSDWESLLKRLGCELLLDVGGSACPLHDTNLQGRVYPLVFR